MPKKKKKQKRKRKRNELGESINRPPNYLPTLEQIAEEAAKIREENNSNLRPRNNTQLSRSQKAIHKTHFVVWDFD